MAYYSLPDKSPYDYYRQVHGGRICIPRTEIKSIILERDLDRRSIVLTTIFGYRFRVTSRNPELQMAPLPKNY